MKTNKNVVRLTESKLKAMVAESVREVLSEIDWKTAAWASNERARRNADVSQNRWDSPYAEKYEKMVVVICLMALLKAKMQPSTLLSHQRNHLIINTG